MTIPEKFRIEGTPVEAAKVLRHTKSYIYDLLKAKVIPSRRNIMPGGKLGKKIHVDMVTVYCMAYGEQYVIDQLGEHDVSEREIQTLLAGFRGDN